MIKIANKKLLWNAHALSLEFTVKKYDFIIKSSIRMGFFRNTKYQYYLKNGRTEIRYIFYIILTRKERLRSMTMSE